MLALGLIRNIAQANLALANRMSIRSMSSLVCVLREGGSFMNDHEHRL